MQRYFTYFLLLAMMGTSGLLAQDSQVKATLELQDSLVEVGSPFRVTMAITHPENVVVIFPDSAAEFAPFEMASVKPFDTETQDGVSRDVAVFGLYTWSIDSLQTISLPYQMVKDGDTTFGTSSSASFTVRQLIPAVTDSTQLRLVTGLREIEEPFNWRAFLFFLSTFLLLVVLGLLLLRKPLRRWARQRRVERDWRPVLARLNALPSLQGNQSEYIRELNRLWKQYIDKGRHEAFTSLTTSELRVAIQRFETLKPSDRALLARSSQMADLILFIDVRMSAEELQQLYTEVRGIMEREYRRRKEAAEA